MTVETKEHLIQSFPAECRRKGLSVTPQRLAVYTALVNSDSHPSPEDIYRQVKQGFPMLSFSTVYKALETFEEHGIISKVTSLHSKLRYDPGKSSHHHMICTKCGKIVDIESEELDALPIPDTITGNNVFIGYSVHFEVICSDCQKRINKPEE